MDYVPFYAHPSHTNTSSPIDPLLFTGVNPMPVSLDQDFNLMDDTLMLRKTNDTEFSLELIKPTTKLYSLALYGRKYDLDVR